MEVDKGNCHAILYVLSRVKMLSVSDAFPPDRRAMPRRIKKILREAERARRATGEVPEAWKATAVRRIRAESSAASTGVGHLDGDGLCVSLCDTRTAIPPRTRSIPLK